MGANLGKSQNGLTYGMPRRRRTVPGENGNHFSKNYWEKADGVQHTALGQRYWMIGSEKEYRDEVFKNKSENIYDKSNCTYHRSSGGSFDSPFAGAGRKRCRESHSLRANSTTGRITSGAALHSILVAQSLGGRAPSSSTCESSTRSSGSTTPNYVNGYGNIAHSLGGSPAAIATAASKFNPGPNRSANNNNLYGSGNVYGSSYNTYSKYVPACTF